MSSVAIKKTARTRPLRDRGRSVKHTGRPRARRQDRAEIRDHAYIMTGRRRTHVILPIEEYERLTKNSMVETAVARLQEKDVQWVGADTLGRQLASERLVRARKVAGLTQKQLGERLGMPQSQISRVERNPDHTSVRTLKQIARALGVDVSHLI